MNLTESLLGLGRPVAYYPNLAKLIGVKETVFICQLCYWDGKQKDADGWIFKSQEDIYNETGLSSKEQRRIRADLVKSGLLEERGDRPEHRMYYRPVHWRLNAIWDVAQEQNPEEFRTAGGGGHVPDGQVPDGKVACAQRSLRSTVSTETTTETTPMEFSAKLRTDRMMNVWQRWMTARRTFKKPKSWVQLFNDQIDWLENFDEPTAFEIISLSLRNGYQGLIPPRQDGPRSKQIGSEAKKHWAEQELEALNRQLPREP
jgi:hypothetical protein